MSVSLKQLTAMVDIAEALATEMRELIALRKIIASESAKRSKILVQGSGCRQAAKANPKFASHTARTKGGMPRSSTSV